jgi:hypothetical protein
MKKEQAHLLMACLAESRQIYHRMLEMVKQQYEEHSTFPSKYDLEQAFKGQGSEHVPATTVQMLADRPTKSLDAYLHEDKKHLIVPKKLGHFLKIKLHRPIEGTPKTVHLVYRADGHWYALIVCEMEPRTEQVPSDCSHPDIGIDVGLKSFLTDSEGHTVEYPRFYRTSQKTLRRKQRTICRRKKDSHRRRKAARSTAQTHLKIARQRRDFHYKTAKQYAEHYQVIAVEKLTILNMVHKHSLAKSILDGHPACKPCGRSSQAHDCEGEKHLKQRTNGL